MENQELFIGLNQIILTYLLQKRRKNKRRWWVRPINMDRNVNGFFGVSFLKMKIMDAEEFFNHTRMKRKTYDLLLSLLSSDLTKRSIRTPINFECRLAITLSYLSQGVSVTFLAWSYKIGKSTVRSIILDTCEVLWSVLSPVYVKRPNESEYRLIAEGFETKWNMAHCVGAIDGKHIEIQAPPNSGSEFFNYKKSFSIVLLATCDANYTFTDISVGAYGSQSDGGILRGSTFGKDLIEEKLPLPKESNLPNSARLFPYYYVADAAFPLRNNLMRPYPGKQLTEDKDVFNYRLSRARRIIENCFGILVSRWRILKTTMCLLPENAEKIVLATIALHNFIKLSDSNNNYIPGGFIDWEDSNHELHQGQWREETSTMTSLRMGTNNASRTAFNLRDQLKEYFMNEGAVPFQFRNINSIRNRDL